MECCPYLCSSSLHRSLSVAGVRSRAGTAICCMSRKITGPSHRIACNDTERDQATSSVWNDYRRRWKGTQHSILGAYMSQAGHTPHTLLSGVDILRAYISSASGTNQHRSVYFKWRVRSRRERIRHVLRGFQFQPETHTHQHAAVDV